MIARCGICKMSSFGELNWNRGLEPNLALMGGAAQQGGVSNSVWFLYLIRCGDGSLYTGIATDVDRRFEEHESQGPKGEKYTRERLPLELVYRREIGNRSEATKEEMRVKALSRKQKLALIALA